VLLALARCGGDIMIASEAVEVLEEIVDTHAGIYIPIVAAAASPLCVSLMSSPDKFVGTQAESVMELLSKIVRAAPGCSGLGDSPLLTCVFPVLVVTMLTCEVQDVLVQTLLLALLVVRTCCATSSKVLALRAGRLRCEDVLLQPTYLRY
jgi:hypothetical protein